jgi:hypothetical protein
LLQLSISAIVYIIKILKSWKSVIYEIESGQQIWYFKGATEMWKSQKKQKASADRERNRAWRTGTWDLRCCSSALLQLSISAIVYIIKILKKYWKRVIDEIESGQQIC